MPSSDFRPHPLGRPAEGAAPREDAAARARRRLHQTPPEPPPAAAPRESYARFIPREEVRHFTAWTPGQLGPAAAEPPAAEPPPPDLPAERAQARAQGRQEGYADGYRDGLVALEGFKQRYAQQLTAPLAALTQQYGAQLDALQALLAEQVADIAVALAREVVRDTVAQRPELIVKVAQEALDATLASARQIVLRVHPEDLPRVAEGVGEALAARGARLQADPQIAPGGCRVDSELGGVEASVAARWSRAVAGLGRALPLEASEAAGPGPAPAEHAAPDPAPPGAAA